MTPYAQIAKKLPSFLYKVGAQAFIKRDFPRHLFIETTASCNLTCGYCPRPKISEDMDFGLFRKIIDEATRFGPRSFSLHIFGEPLLYPLIFEACAYIKRRNKNHTILFTTNGTKINDCIDDIVRSGIDQIYWTWRPEARFTGATLLKLRKWKKFRVRFIDEITPKRAREEWENWGNVEGRNLHNYGGMIKVKQGNQMKRWQCYHLWLAPAVAWNGNFLMCCADPGQKEVFGDINKESVNECWQRVERVRESHLKGEYGGICGSCDVWKQYPNLFFNFQLKGEK